MKNNLFLLFILLFSGTVKAQDFEFIWDDNKEYEKKLYNELVNSYTENSYTFLLGTSHNYSPLSFKDAYRMNYLDHTTKSDIYPYMIKMTADQKFISKINIKPVITNEKDFETDDIAALKKNSFILYKNEKNKKGPNSYFIYKIDNSTGKTSFADYFTLNKDELSENNRNNCFTSTDSSKVFVLFQKIAKKVPVEKDEAKKIGGILLNENGEKIWTFQTVLDDFKETNCNIEEALVLPNGDVYFIIKDYNEIMVDFTLSGALRNYKDKVSQKDKTYKLNFDTYLYKISENGKSITKINLNNSRYNSHYLFYNAEKNIIGFIGTTHDSKDIPYSIEYNEINPLDNSIKTSTCLFPKDYTDNINKYLASVKKLIYQKELEDKSVRFINHLYTPDNTYIIADFNTGGWSSSNSFSNYYYFNGDIYILSVDNSGKVSFYNKVNRLFSLDHIFANSSDYKPYPFLYKGNIYMLRNSSERETSEEKIQKAKIYGYRKEWSLILEKVEKNNISSQVLLTTCDDLKIVNTSYIYRMSDSKFLFKYEEGRCGSSPAPMEHQYFSTLILK